MKVFQVFMSYPNSYQPYNNRLVEGLKKEHSVLKTFIVSLDPPKNKSEADIIYPFQTHMFIRIKQRIIGLFLCIVNEGVGSDILKKSKIYGRYSFVIRNKEAVFHFHNLYSINKDLLPLLIKYKIKYIVSLRGYDVTIKPLLNKKNADQFSFILQNSWKIHSVCESLKKEAIELAGIDESKVKVIYRTPNVKNLTAVNEITKFDATINLFTISRVHWKKCVSESLISIKQLLDEGYSVNYHIIGGFQGYEEEKLIFLIKKLNLTNNVILHGYLKEEVYSELLSKMHICWIPTVNEGLPNTLYYVLKSGFPTIAAATDGIPEVIIDNENGLLFEPYNFNDLAIKTKTMIDDDLFRMKVYKNAKNTILQEEEIETQQYIDLYTTH